MVSCHWAMSAVIPDPQLYTVAQDELRQAEARLLKDYQAKMASIQSETEEWRAKGLPVDELLQSKPFLDDAQRYIEARRLGKAIASRDQCIEFVLNVDDEMTRWAADFEQLWDAARKLFSSLAYSPAGASLMDAAEIFGHCQQCYDVHHRHPTQALMGEMRALVDQLQALIDAQSRPCSEPSSRHRKSRPSRRGRPHPSAVVFPRDYLVSGKQRPHKPAAATDDSEFPARNAP